MHKIPKTGIKKWIHMNKLEQVCINWTETTESLLKIGLPILKFENIVSSFKYLNENLLLPLKINISENEYYKFKNKRVNITHGTLYRRLYSRYKRKHFENQTYAYERFNKEEIDVFNKICGNTIKKLKY